jgi:hypothetical protein
MAAELFGTNLRASAATTIPNIVRGALPLMSFLFAALQWQFTYSTAALITGIVVLALSVIGATFSEETHGKNLDFVER